MTAKEKRRERTETLTEEEAAETLRLLDRRSDPLSVLLANASLDDEPVTEEEEAAVQVAREEIARGETISLDELLAGARRRALNASDWRVRLASSARDIKRLDPPRDPEERVVVIQRVLPLGRAYRD